MMGPDKTSLLARMREEAFNLRGGPESRAGRGTATKAHLLDDEDQNIGNGQVVNPQLFASVNVETNPPRLLALDATSPTGQLVTVILTAQGVQHPDPPFNADAFGGTFGGPIIGIIEFGNGSVFTRVEVDVPIGPIFLAGNFPPPRENQDSGVAVTVPAGTLRVYARHDGNLIPSDVSGVAMGASGNNAPPLTPDEILPESFSPTPVLVKAFVNYFTRATSNPPTRTVYVLRSSIATALNFGGGPFLGQSQAIPPFATTARIIRGDVTAPVAITIYWMNPANNDCNEQITVPAGVPSPKIIVPRNATWFFLTTSVAIQFCAVEFEIEF